MDDEWEEFERGPRTDFGELHASISSSGRLLIGAKAVKEMGDPPAVMLLFNKKEKMIGVRPVHPRNPKAIASNANSRDNHRVVRAHRFLQNYGIEVERTVMFTTPVIEDGMLKLDLKNTVPIGSKRGK